MSFAMSELPCVDVAIFVPKRTLIVFNTVNELALVYCAICEVHGSIPIWLALLKIPCVDIATAIRFDCPLF